MTVSSTSNPVVAIPPNIPPLPILPEFIDQVNLANSQSKLLNDIYAQFSQSGSFVWSNTGSGTYTIGMTVHLDPDFLPGTGSQYSHTLLQLAATLGHEMTHALLPTVHQSFSSALNPDQVRTIGVQNEGEAYLAEYVIAEQLGGGSDLDKLPKPVKDALDAQFKALKPLGVTPASFTTLQSLTGSPYFEQLWTAAGDAVANQDMTSAGYQNQTYASRWVDN
jgi:hypothetical protein